MKNVRKLLKAIFALTIVAGLFTLNSCQKERDCNPSGGSSSVADPQGSAAGKGGVVWRPFSDYRNAQAPFSYFAWGTAVNTPTGQRFAEIDYNGDLAYYLPFYGGPTINTQITGSVSEQPLPDGRAQVTVTIEAQNVLSYGYTNYPVMDFGYDFFDLINNPTLTPALGWAKVKFVFYNSAMAAPLPDLITIPITDFVAISIHSSATGDLHASSGFPEGSAGVMKLDQVGLFKNKNFYIPKGKTGDAFPVENINYSLQ